MAKGERLIEVSFENLKTLRSLRLTLAPFTVIIGKNGVGKTTVLDGIDAVVTAAPRGQQLEGLFVGPRSFDRLASRQGAERVSLRYRNRGGWFTASAIKDGVPHADQVEFWQEKGWKIRTDVVTSLFSGPSAMLRLDSAELAKASPASTGSPRLGPSGEGLPTVLNHFVGRRRDPTFGRILDGLRRVVPEVEDLETEPTEVLRHVEEVIRIDNDALTRQREERLPGHRLFLHMRGIGRIEAHEASEGTLLVLGLLTALYSLGANIILVDDLDRALHPEAQLQLVDAVRAIVEATGVQVIATAHSPVVLMGMREEEIIRLELDAGGATRVVNIEAGAPGWMTGSEILERYFGLARPTALSAAVQRYALLAGDPHRSDADQAELVSLRQRVKAAGLELDLEPVPQEEA